MSSDDDYYGEIRPTTATEELAAQIVDCASMLTCLNVDNAVRSIRPLSPRGRTVTARVSWQTAAGKGDVQSVDVRFSYNEGFTCGAETGSGCVYETLMSLLVANGCGAVRMVCEE